MCQGHSDRWLEIVQGHFVNITDCHPFFPAADLWLPNFLPFFQTPGNRKNITDIASGRKTLSPPGPMSCLCGLALRIWTSFWGGEDSDGMNMWSIPVAQLGQPLTYRLTESVGLGGEKWHGSCWRRGDCRESRLSAVGVPGGLVWDLLCVQQASYLEGGPLMWMLPLYLHVNQKSDYDDDDMRYM